jgi:hypothetical protein
VQRSRHSSPKTGCVLGSAETRLQELHSHWHSALGNYNDPDGFRIALNACLQSSRNLTFAVQKQKAFLATVSEIYPTWQTAAKADSILKWANGSRTRIVHEKDLEADSILQVSLSRGYEDAADLVSKGMRPEVAPDVVARREPPGKSYTFLPNMSAAGIKRALGSKLPDRILRMCSIVMERRWVDRELPDIELLNALAYCYTQNAKLLAQLHAAVPGMHHILRLPSAHHTESVSTDGADFVRPRCMGTTREFRTIEIDLSDESVYGPTIMMPIKPLDDHIEVPELNLTALPEPPVDPYGFVPTILDVARSIVRTGQQHLSFIWFFRGPAPMFVATMAISSDSDKRRCAQIAAETTAAMHFDGVMTINEAWLAPLTIAADGFPVLGRDHPEKREAIVVEIQTADGRKSAVSVAFHRDSDRSVHFDRPIEYGHEMKSGFFEPIQRVWRSWPLDGFEAIPDPGDPDVDS